MGLCKCPKRRVTNQFCFEHRVNVCEWCMVSNHPKCIVQSYLQWLQDSDYNPICVICTKALGDEECIRLTCYHVYHWWCLENKFRSLPSTTAPAGYTCPSCRAPLFPAPNLVSPVADVLREKLAGVNWARAGLGLPLLSEDMDMKVSPPSGHRATPVGASDDDDSPPRLPHNAGPPYSVVQMQEDTNTAYTNRSDVYQGNQAPRRIFDNKAPSRGPNSQFDHDDDKYKRKSALEWIIRWWKNTLPPARNRRSLGYMNRRTLMAVILVSIIIVTLLVTMGRVGRSSIENDPAFDPLHNPHINVQREMNS